MRPDPEGTPPWSKGFQLIAPRDEVGQYPGPRDVISLPGDVGRSIDSILGQSGLANVQDHACAPGVAFKSMTFCHPPRPPGSRWGGFRVCAVSAFSRMPGSGGGKVRPAPVGRRPMVMNVDPARPMPAKRPSWGVWGVPGRAKCGSGHAPGEPEFLLQDVEIRPIAAYAAPSLAGRCRCSPIRKSCRRWASRAHGSLREGRAVDLGVIEGLARAGAVTIRNTA
jgi:hypothetical protein